MLVELIERSLTNRNKIVQLSDVSNKPSNFERYTSVFPYTNSITEYVKSTGSVSGYNGARFVPYLIFDIDNSDLFIAQKHTIELINGLVVNYGISPNDLEIYFSGKKGYHVYLPEKLFGGIELSDNNISLVRNFVDSVKAKLDIDSIDTKIYTVTSVIRVENSLNTKGNMYKIPLSLAELSLHIFEIQKLALNPRTDFKRPKMLSAIMPSEKLRKAFYEAKTGIIASATNSSELFEPVVQGSRNEQLFKSVCILINKSEFDFATINKLARLLNSEYKPPLPDYEVDTIIKHAIKTTGKTEEEVKKSKFTVKSIGEWNMEWYQNILPENSKISLLFPRLDEEFCGKLRGKVGVMIGYAGSKKSMYGQNLAYHNVVDKGLRVVYSSMESSAADCNGRFVNMALGNGYDKNPEQVLIDKEIEETGYAKRVYDEKVAKLYGDKLLVTEDSSMESSTYSEVVDYVANTIGSVDMLVVDGLSMMGGIEDSTRRAERHSKELKELAKKYNLFVLVIVHSKRGEDETTRDLSGMARDSEKIRDNADFYSSFSKIQMQNSLGDTMYEQNRGFIRTVNKRGSGNVIDIVYKLDPISLIMSDTGERLNKLSLDF